jgi:hypothetical protein
MGKRASKRAKSSEERKPPSGDMPCAQYFPQPARRGGEDELPIVALGIGFALWTNQKMSDLARKDSALIGIYFSIGWTCNLVQVQPVNQGQPPFAVEGIAHSTVVCRSSVRPICNMIARPANNNDTSESLCKIFFPGFCR